MTARESRPQGERAADVSTGAGADATSVDPDADPWRTSYGRHHADHVERTDALRARYDALTGRRDEVATTERREVRVELDTEFVRFGFWRRRDPEVRRLRAAERRAERARVDIGDEPRT